MKLSAKKDNQEELSVEEAKGTRMSNKVAVFMMLAVGMAGIYSYLVDFPPVTYIVCIVTVLAYSITLILNSRGKHLSAKIYFLLIRMFVIFSVSIIFGQQAQLHFFLIPVMALPLLLLKNEIGNKKWILVGIVFPMAIYLKWHFGRFDPIVRLDNEILGTISHIANFTTLALVCYMFFVFITESDGHIKKIIQKEKALKKSNEDLDQFAYIVSHDLKAPLQVIRSYVSFLKEEGKEMDPEELENTYGIIEERTAKAEELITSIFAYSKAGRENDILEEFSLNELVQNIFGQLNLLGKFKTSTSSSNIKLFGSRIQIEQVLSNLISNAAKYNSKKRGEIAVRWHAIEDGLILISVEDNGDGIPDKYLEKIFNIFETAGASKKESTGIGLAIVKKLVVRNGGEIKAKSTEGQGSKFTFTWKIIREQ